MNMYGWCTWECTCGDRGESVDFDSASRAFLVHFAMHHDGDTGPMRVALSAAGSAA